MTPIEDALADALLGMVQQHCWTKSKDGYVWYQCGALSANSRALDVLCQVGKMIPDRLVGGHYAARVAGECEKEEQ